MRTLTREGLLDILTECTILGTGGGGDMAEGIGLISLSVDLGLQFKVRLHIDAAAALGIIERRGVGRVRHLNLNFVAARTAASENVLS